MISNEADKFITTSTSNVYVSFVFFSQKCYVDFEI